MIFTNSACAAALLLFYHCTYKHTAREPEYILCTETQKVTVKETYSGQMLHSKLKVVFHEQTHKKYNLVTLSVYTVTHTAREITELI